MCIVNVEIQRNIEQKRFDFEALRLKKKLSAKQ